MKKKMLAFLMAVIIVVGIFPVTAMANDPVVKQISTSEDLVAAIKAQQDGETWILAAGTYDVKNGENGGRYPASINGGSNFAFPITASNLTIKAAEGADVTITSSYEASDGVWDNQNFITVSGQNVTIEGVKLQGNKNTYYDNVCNKVVELIGDGKNLTLKNVECIALTDAYGDLFSGSIYINVTDAGTTVLENVTLRGWINAVAVTDGAVNVKNSTIDFVNNTYSGYHSGDSYAWQPAVKGTNVTIDGNLTVKVDEKIELAKQVFNENLRAGTVVELNGDVEVDGSIEINKNITFNGNGKTITAKSGRTDYGYGILNITSTTGATIENVKFDGLSNLGSQESAVYVNYGATGTSTAPILVKNCTFIGADKVDDAGNAIGVSSDGSEHNYIDIEDCTFTNMKYAMYFNHASNLEITGNTIDGTKYNGINIADNSACPCDNIVIQNNTLKNISAANYNDDTYSSGIYVGENVSNVTVSGNDISMLNEKKPVNFKDETKAVAKNGYNYYATLAEAVDEVRNGDTITVLKDTNEVITVKRNVKFTLVVAGDAEFKGDIKPGDHYRRDIDGNKYTFRYYETGDPIVIGGNRNKDTKTETKEENPDTGAPVMSMGALVVLAAAYVATRKH